MEDKSERIQKITEALYRVTDLFSDKEPLKWQLRTSAIELFDFLSAKERREEFFYAGKAFEISERISRLLKLAYEANSFISNINFEILRREYLSLGDSLKIQIEDKKILFSLEPVSNGHNGHNGQCINDNGHGGQIKESQEQEPQIKENNIENNIKHQPIVLEGLKDRKKRILSLLGQSEWTSIRDICNLLPELGAKSVQRDILEMVEAGILKKAGDKRWRKYSLAALV